MVSIHENSRWGQGVRGSRRFGGLRGRSTASPKRVTVTATATIGLQRIEMDEKSGRTFGCQAGKKRIFTDDDTG